MKSEVRVKRGARGVLSVMLLALGIVPVAAQRAGELPKRASILDIQIGTAASEIPEEFINYACGTNGGPPSIPLANFTRVQEVQPDMNGLREVYFEYDDELEYRALALDLKDEIRMYSRHDALRIPHRRVIAVRRNGKSSRYAHGHRSASAWATPAWRVLDAGELPAPAIWRGGLEVYGSAVRRKGSTQSARSSSRTIARRQRTACE